MSENKRTEWNDRAPRQSVMKFARLRWPKDDEQIVSMKDISRSGVRVLVPRDAEISLSDAVYRVELVLGVSGQVRRIELSLARVCGQDDKHMDLAFKFVTEQLSDDELATLGNVFFGR